MKQPTCPKCGYPLEETQSGFGINWVCPNCKITGIDLGKTPKKSKKKGKVIN